VRKQTDHGVSWRPVARLACASLRDTVRGAHTRLHRDLGTHLPLGFGQVKFIRGPGEGGRDTNRGSQGRDSCPPDTPPSQRQRDDRRRLVEAEWKLKGERCSPHERLSRRDFCCRREVCWNRQRPTVADTRLHRLAPIEPTSRAVSRLSPIRASDVYRESDGPGLLRQELIFGQEVPHVRTQRMEGARFGVSLFFFFTIARRNTQASGRAAGEGPGTRFCSLFAPRRSLVVSEGSSRQRFC